MLCFTSALSGVLVPFVVFANPQGGVVSAGAATINSAGNTLTINQSTDRAVIDWRSFNIGPNETTRFNQPSTTSHTLNRVNDTSRSVIDGLLQANGSITIVNPNGVFFSSGSTVDVAGLVATSADIRNDDFMASRLNHTIAGHANASIVNNGSITVHDAGLAAFVAPSVENNGTIVAQLGKVKLAAGETFTLDMAGDGLLSVAVDANNLRTQVLNSGHISADGGSVELTTAAARNVVDSLINNSGVIEAKSIGKVQGSIVLYAEGSNAVAGNIAANKGLKTGNSTVIHSGTIDVSGRNAGEHGGTVKVLGDQIALTNGSYIDASGYSAGGTINVGGDYRGIGTTAAAKRLFVENGASIANDAIVTGDAGRTIFWSDGNTQFSGNVSATSQDGMGGFTEVSGKNMLGFDGLVDLRSAHGTQGSLLLDPTNITISVSPDTGTMGFSGGAFTDTTVGSSNLNVGTLVAQLGMSDVTISTASAQAGAGIISVYDAINWASNFGLTLLADYHVILLAPITNTGSGSLTVSAGNVGVGDIRILSGADVNLHGGALTLTASPAGSVMLWDANVSANGITINNDVTLNGTTGTTRTFDAGNGTFTAGNISAGDKNLQIIANSLNISGTLSGTTGGILLSPHNIYYSIGVGSGGSEDLVYSTAFVNSLKANFANFTFGRSTTGDIVNHMATWNNPVTFLSGGTFMSGVSITADADVAITTAGNISLDHSITSINGPITLDAHNLYINNGANIDAGLGLLTLSATGGAISVANADLAGTGVTINDALSFTGTVGTTRTINAGTGTFTLADSISAGNKNLRVLADDINLTGGITSTTGDLTLQPFTDTTTVGIGSARGIFHIDDTELALLDAGSGILTLGSATGTGDFNISTTHVFDEHVVFDTDTGLMTLQDDLSSNGKNITFATNANNFFISRGRTVSATGGGDVNFAGINGSRGGEDLTVNALGGAINIADTIGGVHAMGILNFNARDSLSLQQVNAYSLFAQTTSGRANITLNGALNLSSTVTPLELASGKNIINNYGRGVFNLTGGGRYLTWSADPMQDVGEQFFGTSTALYSRNYGDAVAPTGNFRNYSSVAPVVTTPPSTPPSTPPFIPGSVNRVLTDARILFPSNPNNRTSGTIQDMMLYDAATGTFVTSLMSFISVDPVVLQAFGLTEERPVKL